MSSKSSFTIPAVAAISFCFIGGTAPAHADLGDQLFKLLPNDGAAVDWFGYSVAISDTTVIVAAAFDDDNGNASGSAYLFNTTTGMQLFKLLPNDGAEDDFFGVSVAISGNTAIVGAKNNDDNGEDSGSAYLFNTITGQQLFKLLPNDGAVQDSFGRAVAISDTTAIVGALGDDDNGSLSGSAYIFVTTTGQQLFKLLPNDGAPADFFGKSVAISGTTAIVGADGDDDNGANSGSAYLFNTTTGNQIAKLLPDDGAASDQFGFTVAISGTTAIVGANQDDDNGIQSGSAYLFDAGADLDTDGDGLLDSWETNGVPYVDADGRDQLYLLDWDQDGVSDADPMHKDLFVEIDAMDGPGLAPTMDDLQRVIDAFERAPVENPDNVNGVNLHLQISHTDIPTVDFPNSWVDFDVVKEAWFGHGTDFNFESKTVQALLEAKKFAFRYCIFGNTQGGGTSSGRAEIGGNDFMVTMGAWPGPGGTTQQKAGTFMHEFGHTLGLRHFGPLSEASPAELVPGKDRHYNYKPNYYSIMNYTWQIPETWQVPGSWPLSGLNTGYSRAALITLDESDLGEIVGLVPAEHAAIYPSPGFIVPFNVQTDPDQPPDKRDAVVGFGSTVDWNDNGDGDPYDPGDPIARDVNRLETNSPASPDTTLPGYEDWPFLDYDFKDSVDFADGQHSTDKGLEEMTLEEHQELDTILPPACVGDITLDGSVGAADLLVLLVKWGPCQEGIACVQDLDENGAVGAGDLLTLLVNWGPCP